jgi:N-acetyl-anhydromuramyl-L-alanine amidase AmpD
MKFLVPGKNDFGSFSKKIEEAGCYTDEQFEAAVKLTKEWMHEFGIKKEDVVRHSDVSGDDVRGERKGKTDPGSGFDWDGFLAQL